MPFGFRADGDVVKGLPATRRIMPFIMPTRNESVVYFDQRLASEKLNAFVKEAREKTGKRITALHVVIAAMVRVLDERPRLNRFVAGHRHYQRRGIWVSYSAKKEKNDDAPIAAVKRRIDPNLSLADTIAVIDGATSEAKGTKPTSTDKELALFLMLPVFLLAWAVKLLRLIDAWGLLPRFFIDGDPLFASVFVANLGSVGMGPAFHHLYEYGNIPIFIVMGAEENGVIPFRYTFDERIEDGLYCLKSLQRLEEILLDPLAHFTIS